MKRGLIALLFLATLATAGRADEIRLKDGSKIVGTIVGFQGDSFKVQTSYGFAMVRKDSIAAIIPGESQKPAAAKPAANGAPRPAPAKPAEARPAAASRPAPARKMGPMKPPIVPVRPVPKAAAAPAVIPAPAPLRAVAAEAKSGKPAPPAAEPVPVRELVRGNQYINQTYGFQMYRPPDWDPIAGARRALPNAVAALGTYDQQTLLVIGRSPANEPLQKQAAATARGLQEIYDNYRPLSSGHTTISGLPAIEQHFRGLAEDHDWWVAAVTVKRGQDMFTILGMTYADSDLIQIQENVIARVIASLQFTPEK